MGNGGYWRTASRIVLLVVGALLLVLLITGLWLVFGYAPNRGSPPLVSMRGAHRIAAKLILPATGALLVVAVMGFVGRRPALVLLAVLSGALAFAASVTGYVLPWDQISLSTVTVGGGIDGYETILFDDNVNYVLRGNTEISAQAMARWFWAHTTVLPTLLLGTLVALAIVTRRRDPTHGELEHLR